MAWWDDILDIGGDILSGVAGGAVGDIIGDLAVDFLGNRQPVAVPIARTDDFFRANQFGGYSAAPQGVQAGGAAAVLGGASGDWPWGGSRGDEPMIGNGFALGNGFGTITTGPRRIIPWTGGVIPSGYRVAQRGARRGTPARAAGVYLVPRRTMNPLNPRALMRAERRMHSFTTWVKRHFRIASAAPKRRRAARCGGRFTKRRK